MEALSRKNQFGSDDIFINRWSPRAFSGKVVAPDILMRLFEAAHWAPSSYNNQPWRFIYAYRQTQAWDTLFNLLVPFNQEWVKNAGVLVLLVAKKSFDHNNKPSRTHSFDAGAAWMSLALQTSLIPNLAAHGIEGFDYDKARQAFQIPDAYDIEMMVAVGYTTDAATLSPELQKRESPPLRRPLEEIAFEGRLKEL